MNLFRFAEDEETEVEMSGHTFTVPLAEGVYYYGVSAYWRTEDGSDAVGDAASVFKIEVTAQERK